MERHVVPLDDLIDHELDDCICGPTTEPVKTAEGAVNYVVVHHSLDGRERWERMGRLYDLMKRLRWWAD